MADSGALPHQSYPVGYEPWDGINDADEPAMGHWTFRVRGGPAFAVNAVLSLRIAAKECTANSARREALERLADGIEAVMDDG